MAQMVNSLASALAARTSRRGMLGRTGQMLLGLVGGSALMALMAGTSDAQQQERKALSCSCSNPCLHWSTCCGARHGRVYDCPSCSNYFCSYLQCTNLAC